MILTNKKIMFNCIMVSAIFVANEKISSFSIEGIWCFCVSYLSHKSHISLWDLHVSLIFCFLSSLCSDCTVSAGFDLGGQVAIEFSHWKSPFPAGGQNLPSPDCVHSEASAVPPISEHLERVSCPASLSVTPLPTCSASQETLCDSSTSTLSAVHLQRDEDWGMLTDM